MPINAEILKLILMDAIHKRKPADAVAAYAEAVVNCLKYEEHGVVIVSKGFHSIGHRELSLDKEGNLVGPDGQRAEINVYSWREGENLNT